MVSGSLFGKLFKNGKREMKKEKPKSGFVSKPLMLETEAKSFPRFPERYKGTSSIYLAMGW